MVWGAFVDEVGARAGMLNGSYVGATGDVAIGVGLGANVLVGGSNRAVALQPLSVEGRVGLNLALGIANLHLTKIR